MLTLTKINYIIELQATEDNLKGCGYQIEISRYNVPTV